MKSFNIFFVAIIFLQVVLTPCAEASGACDKQEVDIQLKNMLTQDQAVRQLFSEREALLRSQGKKLSPDDFEKFSISAMKIDKQNQFDLDSIVATCGWPRSKIFANSAVNAAFMIVQHADLTYQLKYFPLIQKSHEIGEIPSFVFAMLQDRILVRQGKPQLYGTQYSNGDAGLRKLGDVADPDKLNERRVSIGLPVIPGYP